MAAGVPPINFRVHEIRTGSADGARADFEKMLAQLASAITPNVRMLAANPGDWGIDAFAGDLEGAVTVWQSKYFMPITTPNQSQQIRESLANGLKAAAANGHTIATWILGIPSSMDGPAAKWWDGWKKKQEKDHNIVIELWDETALVKKLLSPEGDHVRRAYYEPFTPAPAASAQEQLRLVLGVEDDKTAALDSALFVRPLGPVGRQELVWALEPLGMDAPAVWCAADLERLRRTLDAPVNGVTHSIADVTCARQVTEGLLDALRTTELLLTWPGAPLTSDRIRRAAAVVGGADCLAGVVGGELVQHCMEFLRLRAPRALDSNTAPLARLVAELAVEDGLGPDSPQLLAWASDTGATLELNDAFSALALRNAEDRMRLVVSLHAAVADEWPETLLAWLLDRDEHVAHKEFPCSPTQSGVEQQLKAALQWATRLARQTGSKLKRVEIAASAALLVGWRPEETDLGMRLGVIHDVVLRWSNRLCPPAHLYWINDYARERLAAMAADNGSGAPLDWLNKQESRRTEELTRRLQNGFYERALALRHRPDRLEDLLEHLLAFTPIVLWPEREGDLPDATRDSVEHNWHRLPGEFSAAYRDTWRQDATESRGHLARLRAAWLDAEWLDFCDWFETSWTDGDDTQ